MKIILNKSKCIGCGSCQVICSQFFELSEDRKSHLKGAKRGFGDKKEELIVKKAGCIQEAVEICPAECIKMVEN